MSERWSDFWTATEVTIKFKMKSEWLQAICFTQDKPDYGMENMNKVQEEVVGNELDLVGPIVDFYVKKIGKDITNTLSR